MSDGLDLVLPLGEAAETFQLEKAVCSHGLFMMAPNQWDPLSKTLLRPLRLLHSLSTPHRQSLLVSRMLRLSETEERAAREFRKMCTNGADADGSFGGTGSGRVFRSPTLFEDMVKCILLCNCQWSRTLSMARALCVLQLELQSRSSCMSSTETGGSVTEASNTKSKSPKAENEDFVPKTPVGKETETKLKAFKVSTNLTKLAETEAELGANAYLRTDSVQTKAKNLSSNVLPTNVEDNSCQNCKSCQVTGELYKTDSCLLTVLQCFEGQEFDAYGMVGNFPSPRELAKTLMKVF
ncbi:uncharacterized protein LOC133881410 isoform X4 [Alnus glutinosa]|uniref:uncharacterized protein LOC133881410 isoform X4 n=1 Tax=Alnus glutinosa TaxID=3517 RepID=UPI002D79F7A5|nr:uncharacterized protein LOC133881410 isoform X4 [Alnus glutinosa]